MNAVFLNVHWKILRQPAITVPELLKYASAVFAPHDIIVRALSSETLVLPEAESLEVGSSSDNLSEEQQLLFNHRNNANELDICVYLVSEIKVVLSNMVLPVNGSSAHPVNKPSIVLAKDAPKWTLAHEIGHVLGLTHEEGDAQRLMYVTGDMQFSNPIPYLVWRELDIIYKHTKLLHTQ